MQTGHDNIRSIRKNDEKRDKRRFAAAFIVLIIIFLLYTCTRTTEIAMVSPAQVVKNLLTALKLLAAKLLKLPMYNNRLEIITSQPYYLETLSRFQAGMIAMLLGAGISIAGAVFQCAFRNPIATPAMLGASGGIKIANLILVIQFSTLAGSMTQQRFIYGYIVSIGILLFIILVSKVIGRKKTSVTDMLLLGSIVTRISGQIINYVQYYMLSETDYLTLQVMNMYGAGVGTTAGVPFLIAALIIGIVPVILTRFSLNALCFGDDGARSMGISAGPLRTMSLICSTVLVVASLIYFGDVGMVSMLVPFVCRYIFGSDIRKLIIGSGLFGALIMMICRVVVSLFAFNQYLSVISIGIIIELISAPVMIVVMLKYRRGWE